jgi:hypothetical protein
MAAGQPAPADGATKKKVPGWSKSLLYAMLRNERYVGQFVWNKRKWTKDPATGKRRYIERPESEWVRAERFDLAIVDRDTWNLVQARHAATAKSIGGARQRSASPHMLSGFLRCGACGRPSRFDASGLERVRVLRAEGRSIRAISVALKTPKTTVVRALAKLRDSPASV